VRDPPAPPPHPAPPHPTSPHPTGAWGASPAALQVPTYTPSRLPCLLTLPHLPLCRYAEWWCHCRPHHSGHQLHFDSDAEGQGGVRNPIVSTVCYLSGGIGGPTLVTDQHFSDTAVAAHGWLVHPAVNRLCMFDGSVLHGVLPGRWVVHPAVDQC